MVVPQELVGWYALMLSLVVAQWKVEKWYEIGPQVTVLQVAWCT